MCDKESVICLWNQSLDSPSLIPRVNCKLHTNLPWMSKTSHLTRGRTVALFVTWHENTEVKSLLETRILVLDEDREASSRPSRGSEGSCRLPLNHLTSGKGLPPDEKQSKTTVVFSTKGPTWITSVLEGNKKEKAGESIHEEFLGREESTSRPSTRITGWEGMAVIRREEKNQEKSRVNASGGTRFQPEEKDSRKNK